MSSQSIATTSNVVRADVSAVVENTEYIILILMGASAKVFKTVGVPCREVLQLATLVLPVFAGFKPNKDRFALFSPEVYCTSTNEEILEFFDSLRRRLEQLDENSKRERTRTAEFAEAFYKSNTDEPFGRWYSHLSDGEKRIAMHTCEAIGIGIRALGTAA